MRFLQSTRIFFTGVWLAAAVLVSAPASAQSVAQAETWTVTPFLATSAGMGDPAPGNSVGLGAAVGYDLTPNIGFEGEIAHLFDVAGDNANVDWSITNVSGNFIYHFDVIRVTPYATFGLGFERSRLSVRNFDPLALFVPSSTEFSLNFGGGVKYALTDRLLVRGDLRRFQALDLAPDYWRLYAGLTFNLRR